MLLLLLLGKQCDLFVIKVFELLLINLSKLLVALEQQVVRGSHMVVFVSIDAFHCLVFSEVVVY